MIQDKIKKGDLIKANRSMWGNFFNPNYGSINIEIKENTLFVAVSDEIIVAGRSEIFGLIDNRIVSIGIRDENQLQVVR